MTVRKPAVLSTLLQAHKANPVKHAAVGPTLTEQTVDERLFKPAGSSKRRRDRLQCRHELKNNKRKSQNTGSSISRAPVFHSKERTLAVIAHPCIFEGLFMAGHGVAGMPVTFPALQHSQEVKEECAHKIQLAWTEPK